MTGKAPLLWLEMISRSSLERDFIPRSVQYLGQWPLMVIKNVWIEYLNWKREEYLSKLVLSGVDVRGVSGLIEIKRDIRCLYGGSYHDIDRG